MSAIGIIGGGNMGSTIARGLKSKHRVAVCELNPGRRRTLQRRLGICVCSIEDLVKRSGVVILAVKPQDMDSVLKALRPLLTRRHLVISIAAGITTSFLEKRLGRVRVVRTMPNLPAQIGEGVTAVAKGKYATPRDVSAVDRLFSALGITVRVHEKEIDAVTAVSGSGPAYVFLFAECLLKAARSVGLSTKVSGALVAQTLSGSVHLMASRNEPAARLRAKVTSKGGTTHAAVKVLTKYKIDQAFVQAIKAAKVRAKQLSKN